MVRDYLFQLCFQVLDAMINIVIIFDAIVSSYVLYADIVRVSFLRQQVISLLVVAKNLIVPLVNPKLTIWFHETQIKGEAIGLSNVLHEALKVFEFQAEIIRIVQDLFRERH